MKWLKDKAPAFHSFMADFFGGLHNRPGGHSLRKLLAIGFFWLTAVLCIKYTDSSNLVLVITVLTGMITALIITYSVSNIKEKAAEQNQPPKTDGE